MKFNIGNVEIENQIVLGPMAGVTSLGFRLICKEFNAGLIYTEMISEKGLGFNNKKTLDMIKVLDEERPISLQLFGSSVEGMIEAAKFIDKNSNCDIIDVNMGCPVLKVVKTGAGSKLMTTPELAYEIIKGMVDNVSKPVTVKIRAGWDSSSINAVEFAKLMEKAGASAIAIHGRTKAQMYSGLSDNEIIKKVKEAVSIPVIGNGDVKSPEDAKRMLDETGCDAVMISRGSLGNPWLIKQTNDYLNTGKYDKDISLNDRINMIIKHYYLLEKYKCEKIAILEMRSQAPWYLKGIKGAPQYRKELSSIKSKEELFNILNKIKTALGN